MRDALYLRSTLPCLAVPTLPIASLVLRQKFACNLSICFCCCFSYCRGIFYWFHICTKSGKRTDEEGCTNFLTADLLHSFMSLMWPLEHVTFTSLIQCVSICESDQGSRTIMKATWSKGLVMQLELVKKLQKSGSGPETNCLRSAGPTVRKKTWSWA